MKFFEDRMPYFLGCLIVAGLLALVPFLPWEDTVSRKPASAVTPADDMSCNCNVKGEKFSELIFEDAATCGKERNYLASGFKAFEKIDPLGLYTKPRDYSKTAEILPRKCMLFAMKHTFPPSFKAELFGVCDAKTMKAAEEDGGEDFTRTKWKPCVDESLVNLVYNSYIDAVDCFGVPPKFAIAKFMNESGVIPNIVASNNDAGLSQFSTGALVILKNEYASWSKRILKNNKQSCQNLLSIAGAMPASADEIAAEDEKKCGVISLPPNPVRNFIYYGAYYHIVKTDVNRSFDRDQSILKSGKIDKSFKSTQKLIDEAKIADFDIESIRKTLEVMAYNTGPKAVLYFKEWLKYRNEKFPTVAINKADLSMTIAPNPWGEWDSLSKDEISAQLDRDGTRAMTFWEWLIVARGKFRYASYVKFYANRLDSNLGMGTCTDTSFLEQAE